MKPFNLEAAKRGEPLCTREGVPVTEFHHFPTAGGDLKCVAVSEGIARFTTTAGRFYLTGEDCAHDLFIAIRKRTIYVNVQAITPAHAAYRATVFSDKDAAETYASFDKSLMVATAIPVEIEE